jgi:hypothetical protein
MLVMYSFVQPGLIAALKLNKNSASADGGPRSQVSTRLTLCSAPHLHIAELFFRAHVWGEGKLVLSSLINSVAIMLCS